MTEEMVKTSMVETSMTEEMVETSMTEGTEET